MNIINFVLIVVALTFAIGLSVAAIIWGLNQGLSSDSLSSESDLSQIMAAFRKVKYPLGKPEVNDDPENTELYIYHHGKN